MTQFTIDWGATSTGPTTAADGTDTLTDAFGNQFDITVSTPVSAGGNQWDYESISTWNGGAGIDNTTNELVANWVNTPTEVSLTFDSGPVTNVSFEIYDLDALAGTWDDQVTVFAISASGALVPVTLSVPGVGHTITPVATANGNAYQIGATGNVSNFVDGPGAPDSVTVSVAGPITGLVIQYNNGPIAGISGVVGLGPVTFTDPASVPCFVRGTMIETNRGDVAVEDLVVGDLVRTQDNGLQALRWVGATTVKGKGCKAPILFRKGAIGNTSDLLLSPEHRVMVQGWKAEVLFGKSELLAAAKTLVNDQTIVRQACDEVEYFHILFDAHEIVFSNGAATESFHPGEASIGSMAEETRQEIYDLFPELALSTDGYGPAVRKTLHAHEVALLNI